MPLTQFTDKHRYRLIGNFPGLDLVRSHYALYKTLRVISPQAAEKLSERSQKKCLFARQGQSQSWQPIKFITSRIVNRNWVIYTRQERALPGRDAGNF